MITSSSDLERPFSGPDLQTGSDLSHAVAGHLLTQAEIRAEWVIAWLRLAVSALLAGLLAVSSAVLEVNTGARGIGPSIPSVIMVGGFSAMSLVAFALIGTGRYRPSMGWAFALLDMIFALAALAEGASRNNLPGNDLFMLAYAWSGPVVFAFNTLRYRPGIVASTAVLYVIGVLGIALRAGVSLFAAPPRPEYARFANLPANVIRLGLIVIVGFCLTIVVQRGRRLLLRALLEQEGRLNLTRFLPMEVASEITRPGSRLRSGESLECAVLFIDLRESTRITEHMSPGHVADFLSRFRHRITRAAGRHGGVIEKFAGDSALIVFGVPRMQPDDCRRALACAMSLLDSVEEWNTRRDRDADLKVAISIHAGLCFCGVVGDEARQEFTVLGTTVNITARLEEIAKRRNECLIVSREVLVRAGRGLDDVCWHGLGSELIRGHEGVIQIYAYRPVSPN